MRGEVIKLDRGLPLIKLGDGTCIRCEHSTKHEKRSDTRAIIGDIVDVSHLEDHDVGIIEGIKPRKTAFIRKDPNERSAAQPLAANFDIVLIAQSANEINLKRLERELVLAFETGAEVAVILTKADLLCDGDAVAKDDADCDDKANPRLCMPKRLEKIAHGVKDLVGDSAKVLFLSKKDADSIAAVKELIPEGKTAILIGRSGVGKSTLVNILSQKNSRATGTVRKKDGKGRHTTVSREIIDIPEAGRIVDMPGVRGLGLWDAHAGIEKAFSDIVRLSQGCRFRDCEHGNEPGCAVQDAVRTGKIPAARLSSYRNLVNELRDMDERKRQANWKN